MSRSVQQVGAFDEPASRSEKPLSDVLIAIPAYNEAIAVGSVVLSAKSLSPNVLVVDDGSTDDTVDIAKQAGAVVIEHDENLGKGAAIRTIFSRARNGDYDAVVVLDGDGQHRPEDIPDVAAPVLAGECDIVVGSRYLEGDGTETPVYRRFGQKTLDVLTASSAGTSLSDTQSGFRAFSPEAVEELTIRTDGLGVESEMIGTASDCQLEIQEVPIDVKYEDVDGQTYNPVHHGVAVGMFVLQLMRDRHPLLFFGLPGIAMLGFGGLLGVEVFATYQGAATVSPVTAAATSFSVMIGVLCLFCGLVLSQVANMIESVDR